MITSKGLQCINLKKNIAKELSFIGKDIKWLSENTGVTKQTLFNIFKSNDIKMSTLQRISRVLEVNMESLIKETD